MKNLKRIILLIGLVLTVGVLSACQNNSKTKKTYQNSSSVVQKGKSKSLIIYFSLTGTTKEAAEYIQKETGADIVRLRAQKSYGDYDSAARRGDHERRNNIHPAIVKNIPNLKKYQTIFIGYPTWWQRPPMVIHTLFDDYNFSGKTIIPFTTSMSTPLAPSAKVIKELAQDDNASFKNGIRYDNNDNQVRNWLKNLNLLKK